MVDMILPLHHIYNLMVSCHKGPTRHAYAWQIGPFWQDTLNMQVMAWYQTGAKPLPEQMMRCITEIKAIKDI